MARYVTFYSYKGGVGRTLALANVAWLLANHRFEPARVLVVDFDLAAPGLAQVFGMKHPKSWVGIVDYVSEYLDNARIPPISRFIHETSHRGIDILPAGRMDKAYQRNLERLDWRSIYSSAYGYELIEKMKADIDSIQPEYDYVLVDSLTGYSDVGGICVKQIPDAVILLFRLNSQNLEGIRSVYRALQSDTSEKKKPIIPVITPSWPFLDAAAQKWTTKAQSLFPNAKLLEISFDSGMSFGEPIISRTASKLPLTSKVLADYRGLTRAIREQNAADPLTIWGNLRSEREVGVALERVDMLLDLLRRRSRTVAYWEYIPQVILDTRQRPSQGHSIDNVLSKFKQFIDSECAKKNKFAFYGRAIVARLPGFEGSEESVLNDLNHALRIDPGFVQARIQRGQYWFSSKKYTEAIGDFTGAIEAMPQSNASQRLRLEAQVASCYLKLYDVNAVLEYIARVTGGQSDEPSMILTRGKALYLKGDYERALGDLRSYLKTGGWNETATLLPAQILAAMGLRQEAGKELHDIARRKGEPLILGNLAEAYLAVDPARTLAIVEKDGNRLRPPVRWLLHSLANILLGTELEAVKRDLESGLSELKDDAWDAFEVTALLRAREREGSISEEAVHLAFRVIQAVLLA